MDFSDGDPLVVPPEGKAAVVFMRPGAFAAGARTATVFDITDGEDLIGIFSNSMKVVRMMEPGEHFFMSALAGTHTIMRADLEAGRIYYVKLFQSQVHPLFPRTQAAAIKKFWESTRYVERNPLSDEWVTNHRNSIVKHKRNAMLEWETIDEARRRKFELQADQGVETPIR
jgi:hypothetical protein